MGKNGTNILGADSSNYVIPSTSIADEGIYTCIVSNPYGIDTTSGAELKVIDITADAGSDAIICNGQSTQLQATGNTNHVTESGTLNFSWSPANSLSNANISNPIANPIINTTYTVTVTDQLGCFENDSVEVIVQNPYQNEEICLVTVDSTSTKNLIVWEKPLATDISSFNIYRQISSVYTLIANVPYSAQSIFTDTTNGINPNITSYRYKISVVDTCGNESDLSSEHRTIHVSISPASPCGYTLFWNDYIGFPVTQYLIYRDSANTGWVKIDSVSFGITAWTDITCFSPNDTIAYLVEVINPAGCTTSKAGAYNSTRSNVQNNLAASAPLLSGNDLNLKIYPNPTNDKFTIHIEGLKSFVINCNLSITNALGELIFKSEIKSEKSVIDLSGQPSGIYVICINSGEKVFHQKLIKK